jgi:hypothetical protein
MDTTRDVEKNARRRADLNTENTRGIEPTRSSPVRLKQLRSLVRGVPVFTYLHTVDRQGLCQCHARFIRETIFHVEI